MFFAKELDWEAQLTGIAGLTVDLQLIGFNDELDEALANDGVLLGSGAQNTQKPGTP